MDLRRVRPAEWIGLLGGAGLIAALMLPWYETAAGAELTGFEAFKTFDVLLALLALVGIALFIATLTQRTTAVPIALASFTMIAGVLALVLLLIRVVNLPEPAASRELGLLLGVAAGIALLAGGYLASRDERITGDTRTVDPADVPTQPAPQP